MAQNVLIFVCFLCSILGLILIYIAATNIQPREISISEITADLIGRSVTITGYITYKRTHPSGHLFLTISDGKGEIDVPIFDGLMKELSKKGITHAHFKKGSKVMITGLVNEYREKLQVQPRKANDIKLISE